MGRRHRRGRSLHGLLLLDKPIGGSSNHALQRVKRLFDARKAGHTGSLDPLACGMLPICFGEATKLSGFLLDANKGYETTLRFGQITDSADADGEIIAEAAIPDTLDKALLKRICAGFEGPQLQVPPMVSAIKIDGKRLYTLAREGRTVDRPPRAVHLHRVELLDFDGTYARLSVVCSKGTYIRSLVSDIGEAVGCGAHVTALRRTFVAPFEHRVMVTFEDLERMGSSVERDACLLPMDAGLMHLPGLVIDAEGALAFSRGQPARVCREMPPFAEAGQTCRVYDEQELLIGLGSRASDDDEAPSQVRPHRVLQLEPEVA